MRLKILLVNKAYFPHIGGVETVARQIAGGMFARGHEIVVLCFGERDAVESVDGVEVRRVRRDFRVGSAPLGRRFAAEFARLSKWADIVNFHAPNPMGELSLLLSPAPRGAKTVCTYHGDAQRPKLLLPAYDALMRKFLGRCDAIIVSNPPLAENSRVIREPAARKKTRVIPLGVRTKIYGLRGGEPEREARRLTREIPLESFKVMYAGRMVYYKGLGVLLDAMRVIRSRGGTKGGRAISAFMVGGGPLEKELRADIRRFNLEGCVFILPHQPDEIYRAMFSLADCFVLPSTHKTEAYGIVLAEAMASGLPPVSTELGTGTSWINRAGETGLVVPPGDAKALADAITRLADNDGERGMMALAARERARNVLEEDTMLAAYGDVFESVYNNKDIMASARSPQWDPAPNDSW
jgi:rhamnosyl/mannosyltransferase